LGVWIHMNGEVQVEGREKKGQTAGFNPHGEGFGKQGTGEEPLQVA